MSRAGRIVTFGSAGVCVVAGAVCALVVSGEAGEVLGMALVGLGLVLATAFVFMEVGLSEDRERAKEERAAEKRAQDERERGQRRTSRSPRLRRSSLERSRGHRRRLS